MPLSQTEPPALLLLHTAEAHCPTFRALLEEEAPTLPFAEIVDAPLLRDTMAAGHLTPALEAQLRAHLQAAKDKGAQAVLCTCSTLGSPAEALGRELDLTTLRVDRGMATVAVAEGTRILVLACVASTLAPTCTLLREEADKAELTPDIRSELIGGAWDHFLAGHQERYLQTIADSIQAQDGQYDVIVLAQASMADAIGFCSPLRSKVLSSPRLGLRSALAALA